MLTAANLALAFDAFGLALAIVLSAIVIGHHLARGLETFHAWCDRDLRPRCRVCTCPCDWPPHLGTICPECEPAEDWARELYLLTANNRWREKLSRMTIAELEQLHRKIMSDDPDA